MGIGDGGGGGGSALSVRERRRVRGCCEKPTTVLYSHERRYLTRGDTHLTM